MFLDFLDVQASGLRVGVGAASKGRLKVALKGPLKAIIRPPEGSDGRLEIYDSQCSEDD